jgi:hypothetical protein
MLFEYINLAARRFNKTCDLPDVMTRYHVSSEPMEKYVWLRVPPFSLYVPNPHEKEHLKDADPHLVIAVLEEIVRQYRVEGVRVSDGQICLFSKDRGRHSSAPIVGMPNARSIEKALEEVGYQKPKRH